MRWEQGRGEEGSGEVAAGLWKAQAHRWTFKLEAVPSNVWISEASGAKSLIIPGPGGGGGGYPGPPLAEQGLKRSVGGLIPATDTRPRPAGALSPPFSCTWKTPASDP